MSPGERKRKAAQLSQLIQDLDIYSLYRQRLAVRMIDCPLEELTGWRDLADAGLELFTLINTLAKEGPIAYERPGPDTKPDPG